MDVSSAFLFLFMARVWLNTWFANEGAGWPELGLIFSGCYCLDLPWKPVSILNVPTLFSKETQA